MTIPYPNPTTFGQMQANRRALNARFFPPTRGAVLPKLPVQSAELENPKKETPKEARPRPFSNVSQQCSDVLLSVLDVSGVTPEDLYESQSGHAMIGRQIAVVVLVRAEIEPLSAASSIMGITIGAAQAALRLYDTLIDRAALPIRHDPVGCVRRLWDYGLRDLKSGQKVATVADCISAVRQVTGLSLNDLRSERRSVHLVKARQIVMWLAKERTTHSLPTIGKQIGGRDHTTVLHGYRKVSPIADLIDSDPEWGLFEWARALWQADWKAIEGSLP